MDEIKMEGSRQDEGSISDDLIRSPSFTAATSVHEAARAKHGNSLHDRFTALASLSSGSRGVKLEITTSNFDFLSTPSVESTTKNREQKNGSFLGNTENRSGAFNMGSRELQDKLESEHENKPASSVKSPGSCGLNPLASTFDASAKKKFNFLKSASEFTPNKSQVNPFTPPLEHTPIKAQFNPFAPPFDFAPTKARAGTTLVGTKAGTNTQAHLREGEPSTDANHTSIVGRFGLEKDVSIVQSSGGGSNGDTKLINTEEAVYERSVRLEKGNNSPNTESEDSDESFEFAPEIEEEEGFGDIKFKQLVENSWRFCLEGANGTKDMVTDLAKSLDDPGFKTIPDTIKSRYPQMAKFLATLVIQGTTASNSNDTPSLPTCSGKPEVCTKLQTVPIQRTISSKTERIGVGLYQGLPIIDAIAITGESLGRPGTCVGVSPSSKDYTAPRLKGQAGEGTHDRHLEKVRGSAEETKTEQVSRHRGHSEGLIVSAEDSNGKGIGLGVSSNDDDMIMPQQDSKNISAENLTTSDDGFFRDSEVGFTLRTPASGRSSISSEGSITFSLREDSISGKESGEAGRVCFEDAERSRRSPGPSPSPKRGFKLNSSTAGSFDPTDFESRRDENIKDPKIVTEGWLSQLSISSENDNIVLPTGRPSVLARIHSRGSVCDDDGSDSDGVAPGEWVKPIELIKKEPPKLKTGDEALMRSSFGRPFKGTASSRDSRRPRQYNSQRPQFITPQIGFQFDKLSEKEKEIVAWREKGMIETTTGDKKTATSLTEGKQERAELVLQRQSVLYTSPYGSFGEDSLKNNSHKMPAMPLQQQQLGVYRGGSSRDSSRGGSALKLPKESVISDVSARWQRFTDKPGSVTQESLCLVESRAQVVPIASETAPEKAHAENQDPFEAKVRKLCPLFFNGPCHQGQSCLDLHPNYDEQSGTFTDKRFVTKRSFYQEAMVKENVDRKTAEALAALIKDSRSDAQRRSREVQMGGKAGRLRPVGLQVANVIVKTNANGEREWTVEQPTVRQLEEEEPKMEADENLPRRQGKRRF